MSATVTMSNDRRTWIRRVSGRSVYAIAALPVGLAGLFWANESVRWVQRTLARRLLGVPVSETKARLRRHSLVSLPANLVSFALMGPAWAVFIVRGVLYPAFGAEHLDQSWGGPTLAGAWAAHFIQGPPLLFAITLVLWPVSSHQARLIRKHLGA